MDMAWLSLCTHVLECLHAFRHNLKHLDRQTGLSKSVDPVQTYLIRFYTVCYSSSTILDTSTGSKIVCIRFQDEYSKELRCLNT